MHNVLLPFTLVVLSGVVAFVLYTGADTSTETEGALTAGVGEVTYTDLSLGSINRLPVGFPSMIPVEQAGIKESYKVSYNGMGATQYTVSFVSSLSRESAWESYASLLSSLGYPPGSVVLDEERGIIRAERGGDKLHIALSPYGSSQYVTINYIERE